MVNVSRNRNPAAQRPLKTAPATGASLATMGIANSIPLMHGAQGCGAFAKVYLIQHFREPMPIQNTAVDQISAVMGADDNIQQALARLCADSNVQCITLMSTGLTELQGTDLQRNIAEFRAQHPHYDHVLIVPVSCPDFVGSLQTGFANTVDALVKHAVSNKTIHEVVRQQVTILGSSALTPADVELIKTYTEAFGLHAIMVPDLSLSLDNHLQATDYSSTSTGGTTVAQLKTIASSCATLVIGESLFKTGQWLEQHFSVPCFRFAHLMGVQATDAFLQQLSLIASQPVPATFIRQRQRLQDTLLDTHFVNSTARVALAMESDALLGVDALLAEAGARVEMAVAATNSPLLLELNAQQIIVGDHGDLDSIADQVDVMFGNTHCAEFFEPSVPVVRFGYPCHDRFGNSELLNVGYQGARRVLNELANIMIHKSHDDVPVFISPYRFTAAQCQEVTYESH